MTESEQPRSAPASYRYCPRCATPLVTRTVGDKPRRACPACDFIYFTDPKVGVGVLVIEEGKILLVRRTMMPERGKWSIPAGFLDRGEDPQVTAVREAREETGLRVTIEGLVDVYFNPPSPQGGASVFILYRARTVGGTLRAGDDADAAEFFAVDNLPELAFASTKDAIRYLQEEAQHEEG
jgi:ADP-ribose pyrophosphatase YjhB (NUDIX family)